VNERNLGWPRLHLRRLDSTNTRARDLAVAGAPHGTLVTAEEQAAGRGRQGRTWTAPAGRALLCSLVIRDPPWLLPLAAGVAVAEAVDAARADPSRPGEGRSDPPRAAAQVKWPNDVLVGGRKVAGILVEGRPQEAWAVLGVGLNVAVAPVEFPAELRDSAATLGLDPEAIEPVLVRLVAAAARWLAAGEEDVLDAFRRRDALRGRRVAWASGEGNADGIDDRGRLLVVSDAGDHVALDAGEVHLAV
jgi:BirA family biotin operon repressor/biotin-[acetyl-CoA-carboxylase] ligase